MADDAAAPDGELSESTATDESSTTAEVPDTAVTGEPPEAAASDAGDEAEEEEAAPAKPPMPHAQLAMITGLALVVALACLTGWVGFRAYQSHQADEQQKLFLSIGRQGALNLTTIDWQHADQDVQRILDSATGTFYEDLQKREQPFVEVVKQAQSKSVGAITEAGLKPQSITANSAQVLVAVAVRTSNAGAPEQTPRAWRMRITVQKVDDEAKVANVEFVP